MVDATSIYDTSGLRATLEELIDFDGLNANAMRFSIGAVNVRSGNLVYFDTGTHMIAPEHIMASGALPPGFPAVEIGGEHYWDGALVSNTPLQWMGDSHTHRDTLAFQVDLWNASGELPRHDCRDVDPQKGDPVFEPHPRGHQFLQACTAAAPGRGRSVLPGTGQARQAGKAPGAAADQYRLRPAPGAGSLPGALQAPHQY